MTIKVQSHDTRKSLEEACKIYEESLPGSVAGLYLTNRGITKEAIAYFRLGYVKESAPFPGHEFKEGRLSIPYITQSGIVQMRFRAVPEDGIIGSPEASPKMLSMTGAGSTLFNVRELMRTDGIIAICEGELDAISAWIAGIPAIGFPGVQNWNKVFARAFRYRKTIILGDNDDSGEGREFAQKIQADLRDSRIVMMDKGYDVNKMLVDFGPDALRKKVGLDG